jgi:hypothetical protein
MECKTKSSIGPSAYLVIIVSIFIIGVFLYRFILICLNCRNVHDENANYQPMITNICINPLVEESPPSYEQVMNDNTQYRFENPR